MTPPLISVVLAERSWLRWLPPFLTNEGYELDLICDPILDFGRALSRRPNYFAFLSHHGTLIRDMRAAKEFMERGFRGIKVKPNETVVSLAFDKRAMAKASIGIPGISTIPTLTLDEAILRLRSSSFSVIVAKPNSGTKGEGLKYFSNEQGLISAYPNGIPEGILLQEFVEGEELSLNAVCYEGNAIFYPIISKGNTSVCGEHPSQRKRSAPANLAPRIGELLLDFGWRYLSKIDHYGVIEFEFILSGEELFFLEINPRLAATMRLAMVVAERSLFVDLLRATCGYPLISEAIRAEALGAEWLIPKINSQDVTQILKSRTDVWCSKSRVTVAAPTQDQLRQKVNDITSAFNMVGRIKHEA